MKHPEYILNTGKTLTWLEANEKELFEAHVKACTEPETYKNYVQYKYELLEQTEKLMQTPLSLGQFVPCKDGKVLEKPIKVKLEIPFGCDQYNHLYELGEQRREYGKSLMEYKQACKEILFDGFIFAKDKLTKAIFHKETGKIAYVFYKGKWEVYRKGCKSIEDLIREVDLIGTDVFWNMIFKL